MVIMFLSLFLKTRGVDEVTIGALVGAYSLMMPIVILGFGFLADRVSCRRLILIGSAISMFHCLLMPHLNNMFLMSIIIALGGIGITLAFIISHILFLKILGTNKRGKRLSLFVAAMTSGYAIGSAICSVFVHELSLPVGIIFYLAFPFHLIAFIIALRLPEVPVERFPLTQYFHDLNRLPVLCLALIAFSLGTHWGSETFSIVRFLESDLQATGFQIAGFFILTGVTLSLFSRLGGHVIDTKGHLVGILVPGLIVSGFFHGITGLSRTYSQFLLFRVLHTCGDGAVNFAVPMFVSMVFVSSRMGGTFGFNRTIIGFGTAVGSAFAGLMVTRYSMGSPFIATGVFQIIIAGIVWLMRSHLPVAKVGTQEGMRDALATGALPSRD